MKNDLDLGKDKIGNLLLSFSIPCVISMLINSIYNIVDQIFIGKGVGTLGNAATNVIFPLVIICNAVASLIGNGTSANLSLRLGEGKVEEAKKSVGGSITILFIVSIILSVLAYIFLPKIVYLFGCTDNVYKYAVDYGRVIILGAPAMIIYTGLSSIIRADGSPKYSMALLVIGAVINLILDPIFIFVFKMGVKGGAFATIIGQYVSFIMAVLYIRKIKSVKLNKKDYIPDKSIFRTLSLGLSSFITQGTVLCLFVFMNNIMTKYGANSKYGADIPLSVYGVISKLNGLFVSSILGVSIGAQPIIGFNYGAEKYDRVKETLKKVLKVNLIIGLIFNLIFLLFPKQVVGIFISSSDSNYKLFMEFAVLTCRTFLLLCSLNFLEMTTSIVVQSLGNVKKATFVSFCRQIILFIPISLLLCIGFDKGVYGALYAGPIADSICFIVCIFLMIGEFKKINKKNKTEEYSSVFEEDKNYQGRHIVVTISREYGSGGRYVGKILADKLGINFYDKELITLSSKESGLGENYINAIDEKMKSGKYEKNNDDRLFIAEQKVIESLAYSKSCVIIGRCADYILKDEKDVLKVFLYSDDENKVNRACNYYGLKKEKALKTINKINNERAKHYKYYTNRNWKDINNYDLMINVDKYGVEKSAEIIEEVITSKF